MNSGDVRWKQRLNNFALALQQLTNAVQLASQRELSDLEKQGLIQYFEFTHELAWNVMKDFFEYQGASLITGSRDATREAFQKGLILQGEEWMDMIKSRNKTSHTYNQSVANDIADRIRHSYFHLFQEFLSTMRKLAAK
ncbi:MAG: nucleotidyltransferase substrate binding protein [Bdellovibrionaceae bacterium]|nr:nucleotidyltransferase substrate binding protein [Pseudobdellovibrionaceae bacterium]